MANCGMRLDINNVGSMSQALFAHGNSTYDERQAAVWQAQQVSYISLMNFSGRIFIGILLFNLLKWNSPLRHSTQVLFLTLEKVALVCHGPISLSWSPPSSSSLN